MHPQRARLLACLMLLILSPAAQAWCQDRPAMPRESFSLDLPLLVAKQMDNIRGMIGQEDWTAAFDALGEVQDEFPDALVTVGPGHAMNAVDYARLLTIHLPPVGLAAYREQIDGWAEQQYRDAVGSHDEQGLRLLLRDAYASSWGDNALWTLGEWWWEQGDVDAARRHWEQLIPLTDDRNAGSSLLLGYPDPEYELADVHARLVLSSLMAGNATQTEREFNAFQQLHPTATGTLAGRTGELNRLLDDLITQSDNWPRATSAPDWPTFAQNRTRNPAVLSRLVLGGPQWTLPLAPLVVPNWQRSRPALPETGPLGRYPVTDGGGLFFHDGTSIRAVRLDDGHPLWPDGDETDIGRIYHEPPHRPVLRPTVGVPRFTATVHRGRLYALTGPSVLSLPEAGLRASPTWLVCLNVETGEGLLEWFHIAEELFPAGWMMTGTPVAARDRLYLPLLRTDPQLEQGVACLSAADGSVIWQRSIGQALRESLDGRVELGHQLLTLCDDDVLCSTDLGVVAALDAGTGSMRWAVTYASTPLSATDRSEEASAGLLPPVCCDGRVFVKPNDSGELMAFDAASGVILWRRTLPSRVVHLLGVAGTDLLVSGDQLWAVDVATGGLRWRFGSDDPGDYGYGRGAFSSDHIFWTTHENLYVIDRLSGRAEQRYPLREVLGVSGGNVVFSHDRLVIAGPDQLTVFGLVPAGGPDE